jgi:hypothetical protein
MSRKLKSITEQNHNSIILEYEKTFTSGFWIWKKSFTQTIKVIGNCTIWHYLDSFELVKDYDLINWLYCREKEYKYKAENA